MHIANSIEEMPDRDTLLSQSGLQFMQAMLDGRLSGPPIARLMNYWLHDVAEGRVEFRGRPGFAHTNPVGGVHGGWFGTVLDSCMSCAVMTCVPRGSFYTTAEFKINIVRTIPLDSEVAAVGVVQHAGRSTGVAAGEIRGVADGRLYATGSATCLIMQGQPVAER